MSSRPGGRGAAAVPSFSVLIAAYRAADTVGEAVASALAQDPAPHEVIVCDDGSPDDVASALEPFGTDVVLLRRPHAGEAAAKNAAAAAASGDFVVFLDADDVYLPGRLAALARLATERPDLDILTTDALLVRDGEILRRCYHPGHRFAHDDQDVAILRSNFVFGHAAVRRERYLEVGGFDEGISHTADWECWIRLILGGSRVGLVDRPLSEYRLHPGAMSVARARMARGRLQTLRRTAERTDLRPEQRAVLDEAVRRERAVLARAELDEALDRGVAIRSKALALALHRGVPAPRRAKCALAVLAPGTVRRRVRDRGPRVRTVGGIELDPQPGGHHGSGPIQR